MKNELNLRVTHLEQTRPVSGTDGPPTLMIVSMVNASTITQEDYERQRLAILNNACHCGQRKTTAQILQELEDQMDLWLVEEARQRAEQLGERAVLWSEFKRRLHQ